MRLPTALCPAALAAALALAGSAAAEEVLLASGTRYDATQITLVGAGQVRFTIRIGGGTGTVTMPWERLDPSSAFAIRAARTRSDDAAGQLALGRFALERGLPKEAVRRFRKAADLDPALAGERDAGLLAARDAELLATLDAAMLDVKRGRGDLALSKAKDVLARAEPGTVPAQRATSLLDLAASVAARDAARLAAEERERAERAEKAATDTLNAALARSDGLVRSALEQRERAADPDASRSSAIALLERAETALREARHALKRALEVAGDRRPEVDPRDGDALYLLVATHVDLADLYRQERRFEKARDRVRAALVLDPENVRAREVRDLIEQDLRTPPQPEPYDDPFGSGFSTTWYGGPFLSSPVVVGRTGGWYRRSWGYGGRSWSRWYSGPGRFAFGW